MCHFLGLCEYYLYTAWHPERVETRAFHTQEDKMFCAGVRASFSTLYHLDLSYFIALNAHYISSLTKAEAFLSPVLQLTLDPHFLLEFGILQS